MDSYYVQNRVWRTVWKSLSLHIKIVTNINTCSTLPVAMMDTFIFNVIDTTLWNSIGQIVSSHINIRNIRSQQCVEALENYYT